jgi:hypothetical protein
MALVPDAFVLRAALRGADLPTVAAHVLDALARASYPSVERWAIPAAAKAKRGALTDRLSTDAALQSADTARVWCGDGRLVDLYRDRDRADLWHVVIDHAVSPPREASASRLLAAAIEASTRLLANGPIERLELYRQGGGVDCLPSVPVAGSRTYAVLATDGAIEAAYEDPAVFQRAGWSRTERFGERTLFIRAEDAADSLQFLRAVQPHQWAMARAAKPGLTRYFMPSPRAEETGVYRAGGPFLEAVGHVAGENLVELSCVLPEGEHLPGWEILNVFALLQRGALPDGRQVDAVRVVFFDQASAEREKRPLLDVGASVCWQGDTGDLVFVRD